MEQFFSAFPGPLPLQTLYGKWGFYLIALLIGTGFGYSLEIGGFGKSTKLAAQFYFTDMTVFKVMFTGIIVAMVLVFGASAIGWLDYSRVFVNPTFFWPGVVGGLIMGVGFVIGGFCPGTSLVAVSTFKKDGMFFVLGLAAGIFLFGENVDALFQGFWNSSNWGRFTLPELLGLSTGVVVFLIVIMALVLFVLVEYVENRMNKRKTNRSHLPYKYTGAGIMAVLAFIVMIIGQPTVEDKWEWMSDKTQPLLDKREVQIEPAELLAFIENDLVHVELLDVRNESDYNLFHIQDARLVALSELAKLAEKDLLGRPANTLFVVMSNEEDCATLAWKTLKAQSIQNAYILEGGINNWLDTYNVLTSDHEGENMPKFLPIHDSNIPVGQDLLQYHFDAALGSNYAAADPDPHHFDLEYESRVKMKVKKAAGGG